jgi:hypothetical protein
MVYKPLAVRVALIAGFRRALPVFRYMIVVAVAVGMCEILKGFPRGAGTVESRLFGFPCFPHPGISMACFWPHLRFSFRAPPQTVPSPVVRTFVARPLACDTLLR